jgi:hypothetical protein
MRQHGKRTDTIAFGCPACHAENTVFVRALTENVRCRTCRARICPINEPLCVREISFNKIVRSAEVPVVVSLVNNRLEECRRGAPDLHDLSREFTGSIIVLILNSEVCPEVSMRISRGTIPQFVIFQRGRIVRNIRESHKRWRWKRGLKLSFLTVRNGLTAGSLATCSTSFQVVCRSTDIANVAPLLALHDAWAAGKVLLNPSCARRKGSRSNAWKEDRN